MPRAHRYHGMVLPWPRPQVPVRWFELCLSLTGSIHVRDQPLPCTSNSVCWVWYTPPHILNSCTPPLYDIEVAAHCTALRDPRPSSLPPSQPTTSLTPPCSPAPTTHLRPPAACPRARLSFFPLLPQPLSAPSSRRRTAAPRARPAPPPPMAPPTSSPASSTRVPPPSPPLRPTPPTRWPHRSASTAPASSPRPPTPTTTRGTSI